jgi:hypothetical protein
VLGDRASRRPTAPRRQRRTLAHIASTGSLTPAVCQRRLPASISRRIATDSEPERRRGAAPQEHRPAASARHQYCNIIEAPWLVNGGHGASLRQGGRAVHAQRGGRPPPRPATSRHLRHILTRTDDAVGGGAGESQPAASVAPLISVCGWVGVWVCLSAAPSQARSRSSAAPSCSLPRRPHPQHLLIRDTNRCGIAQSQSQWNRFRDGRTAQPPQPGTSIATLLRRRG